MISKWFRFGIPLGSATILAALLDLVIAVYWFLNDFGSYIYFHVWELELPIDYRTVIGLIVVSAKVTLAILLWIFIFSGQKLILVGWIAFSLIADILLIGHGVNNCTHVGDVSDEIWFLNLAIVILLRLYLSSVICQAFSRLQENAKAEAQIKLEQKQNSLQRQENGNGHRNGPSGRTHVAVASLHRKTYPGTPRPQPKAPKYLKIEPIGKGLRQICEFYDETPRLTAVVLTIFEFIWNVFVLGTYSMTEFLFRGKLFFMPKEEEILMRVWRILLGVAAMLFLFRRRKTLLRFFLLAYFWTSIFASLCLFFFSIFEKIDYDTSSVVILALCTTSFWDNILRFTILYFCLRVTTQPPLNLNLQRTPSLVSRTGTSRIYLDRLNNSTGDDSKENAEAEAIEIS